MIRDHTICRPLPRVKLAGGSDVTVVWARRRGGDSERREQRNEKSDGETV